MKCEFCGAGVTVFPWFFDYGAKSVCAKCKPVCANILTIENARLNSREVMIGQHKYEPARKLLELKNHTITVFVSELLVVIALEIESRVDRKVLRWNLDGRIGRFNVRNVGSSYANRDDMIPCKDFDVDLLFEDIELSSDNLHSRVHLAISSLRSRLDYAL